ncbi:restriction endonuclease [Micrococcales bacterium 31B]|nr:restriction endonuclease [Micrococcales bacterium 31B]
MLTDPLFTVERDRLHGELLRSGMLSANDHGIVSIADKGQRQSVQIAHGVYEQLLERSSHLEDLAAAQQSLFILEAPRSKAAGQTSGTAFEHEVSVFLARTLPALQHVRPGKFTVEHIAGRGDAQIHRFRQYTHLKQLDEKIQADAELRAALGNAYDITPDIVIAREPLGAAEINRTEKLIDDSVATRTALRRGARLSTPLLHAVVSCKWTMRSDRAQNARSEALNLIRNRKGHQPHIVVVTAEPTPSRLASLALGTGDIDCLYHLALPELVAAVAQFNDAKATATLATMIEGERLKDIADLPLDLVV